MDNFIPETINQNQQNNDMLINAAKNGDLDAVVRFLDRGADIEAVDQYGRRALIWAVGYGHKDIVELLFDRGANIDAVNKNGLTALMSAAANGHKAIVELLLDRGANIDAEDQDNNTAITCVVIAFVWTDNQEEKDKYREIFRILAENHALINEETQYILDEKDVNNDLKQYIGSAATYLMK